MGPLNPEGNELSGGGDGLNDRVQPLRYNRALGRGDRPPRELELGVPA